MIICKCREPHREHEFTPAAFGLCAVCSHVIGAHKSSRRRNAEIAERVTRLLHVYEIDDWRIRTTGAGVELELSLISPGSGGTR